MSISREEFLKAATDAASEYQNVAQYIRAGDPRVLAQLGAQATMLSMLSAQIDVAKFEPFLKARDATVMADASLKGILPLGRSCKLTLTVSNSGSEPITLDTARRLVDPKGRLYELDRSVLVPAKGSAAVTATQLRRRTISRVIDQPADFYRMQIPLSSDEMHLNTISVFKGGTELVYHPDWFNVLPDQAAYQVEVDELRRMFVVFGKASVIGYGVRQGDQFKLDITECNGRIDDLRPASQFTLEYILASAETALKAELASVQDEGAAPATMPEMRVMARYPAIYDHNAVYLGEFAFLLRRYLTGIRFLSVWNEQVEEAARGPNVRNINTIFVSGLIKGMTDATFQARARELIRRADSSYRVAFVNASLQAVAVVITASVAINWDRATVEAQIRALLLDRYGDGAIGVSEGRSAPIRRSQLNKLLRENIDALRDERAEYDVKITLPATILPEHFLFISPASLTVNVSSADYGGALWNY